MNILNIPIADLKPYAANVKRHPKKQIDLLAKNITRFGFTTPLLIDEQNNVIAGHGRLLALQQLQTIEAPCVRMEGLSEKEIKALRIADNKIAEMADWETDALMSELLELDPELFDLTGFDTDILLTADEKDDALPTNAPTVAQKGDLWQLGTHRLLCGDSLNAEDMDKLMDGKMADMSFTDPPWNVAIGEDSNPRHRQREGLINDNLGDGFPAFLKGFASQLVRYNAGDLYCVMGCEQWPAIHEALSGAGLHWSATVIWLKDIFVLGRSKYHRRYEPIWYGWKDKSTYAGDRKQDDVWEIPRPKRSEEHPTMKPIELVVRAIVNSSQQGNIVLDIFGGSGSTLIAAEKTQRICYGMEIDPKYVDVIIKRWEDYTGKKAIKI